MKYTVKAAALATGISESRLRTWERRYGIPSPNRSATGRRLYDDADLAIIRRMSALVEAGVSAVDAADAARSDGGVPAPAPALDHPLVARFATAAEHFDEAGLLEAINAAVDELAWAEALDTVIFPGMKRVGIYWETALFPPANEHFASELVRQTISTAIRSLPLPAPSAPKVILACPQDERHDIGLLALMLTLRQAGFGTVYLGADVPAGDIVTAYDATGASAICLSATTAIGLASMVRASRSILTTRRIRLFLGGPAVSPSGAEAAGVRLPLSINAATDALIKALTRHAAGAMAVLDGQAEVDEVADD